MVYDNKKVEEIMDRIKKGEDYTIACSMYEEYFWYKDGNWYKSMENGMNEPIPRKTTEDAVKRGVIQALMFPEMYDGFFE